MSINRYGFRNNPFNIVPNFKKPIWAGFPELKEKFENRIKISFKIPNSSIILNWGEYGSGKTHAARYFTHKDVLEELINDGGFKPFSILLNLPKGKNPIYELYTSIIDLLDIDTLRGDFADIYPELETYIDSHFANKFISASIKLIFNNQVNKELVSSFLYGNINSSELKDLRGYNIYRKIETENDINKLISGLFNCLTFNRLKYSNIYFWIDEFEDISLLNNTNISKVSNFLREIFDDVPSGLLLLLNLTQTAFINAEDLGQYLSDSVQSRIKQKIDFPIPELLDIKLYLKELLKMTRDVGYDIENEFDPFEENIIDDLCKLLDNNSIRKYNEKFSLLIELGDLYDKEKIDFNFYIENRKELFGWL